MQELWILYLNRFAQHEIGRNFDADRGIVGLSDPVDETFRRNSSHRIFWDVNRGQWWVGIIAHSDIVKADDRDIFRIKNGLRSWPRQKTEEKAQDNAAIQPSIVLQHIAVFGGDGFRFK